jgi:hypothetical protein
VHVLLKVGKNQLRTLNEVRHSLLAHRTLATQMQAATQVCPVQKISSFSLGKKKICTSINFRLVSADDSCNGKTNTPPPHQHMRRGSMIFAVMFNNGKIIEETGY